MHKRFLILFLFICFFAGCTAVDAITPTPAPILSTGLGPLCSEASTALSCIFTAPGVDHTHMPTSSSIKSLTLIIYSDAAGSPTQHSLSLDSSMSEICKLTKPPITLSYWIEYGGDSHFRKNYQVLLSRDKIPDLCN